MFFQSNLGRDTELVILCPICLSNKKYVYHLGVLSRSGAATATRFRRTIKTTGCIITGAFISLKMHNENVSEKEPIFADPGLTKRALDA
jgi:hypothetical protein